ncbi:conserved hypothetical protein [Theileria orientalis strain Shintoku]|uniref:Uncharacterized protein n=1 Tax=Theileria orientalis strain Shintoku TaxID=869250 RepID=J4C4G2_THEOR|nr:conserved hypothetical protein [Theileria orientalis strain Shintoku]PVC50832.1 hypothetical protein MACL_00002003 [Theileria orientalis]BAM42131.1 conserved hypothetical protein [Theileria orientalis strain Shintoku]|eukprot:XP_009692432.1 conserved hypothetical protein [Theileria orientalis strain Shintoku]
MDNLSFEFKNKRSLSGNHEVQSGADNPNENNDNGYTSGSFCDNNEDSVKINTEGGQTSFHGELESVTGSNDNEFKFIELETYRIIITKVYKIFSSENYDKFDSPFEKLEGSDSKDNDGDSSVASSKSEKSIDSLRVNLDSQISLNSATVGDNSIGSGRMESYKTTNTSVESDVDKSPLIKVEPTFKYNTKGTDYSDVLSTKVEGPADCTVYNQDSTPSRSLEVNSDNPHGSANESMDDVASDNSVTGYSDIYFNEVKSTDGKVGYKIVKLKGDEEVNYGSDAGDQDVVGISEYTPNNDGGTDHRSGFDNISKKDLDEGFDVPDYSPTHKTYNYIPTPDCHDDAGVCGGELTNLIRGTGRLHGFKINNRGVNVPLFLNVGTRESVYSGQAFVSNTKIGLFKISVVEPIEPKVNLASKIVNLVGLNNYRENSCRCTNLTAALALKKAIPVTGEVVNNVFNRLEGYKPMPWINPLKSYVYEQLDNVTRTVNSIETPEVVVCDFHKNLFSHRVDRTRFGKDLFCQLKYISTIGMEVPVRVDKNGFTSGSNVSSFFNGFHEQLLCVGDTSRLGKLDLHNNHKFTFIIRRVKGSRYGKNFTILNTTSGQHLCLDMLTHELRFEEECKFSKYLVPAIFKIIPLPDIIEAVSKNVFDCFSPVGSHCPDASLSSGEELDLPGDKMVRYPTCMSTTDQYVNIA